MWAPQLQWVQMQRVAKVGTTAALGADAHVAKVGTTAAVGADATRC